MRDIYEVWIPYDVFQKEYPECTNQFLIKIHDMIVIYKLYDDKDSIFFSLEDALVSNIEKIV